MTIDGRLLIDEPYMMRSDSVNEIRLAQKSSELMLAAGALWGLGERTAAFVSCESPDFIVRLANERLIGVEVTEVVAEESARRSNTRLDLSILLKDAVDADPTLWPSETYLAFNFAPHVDAVPNARERSAIVEEIIAILRDKSWGDFVGAIPGYGRDPKAGSMLDRYGMWLHVGELPGNARGHVEIFGSAFSFDPRGLVDVAITRLKDKTELAKSYRCDVPLWLVLAFTDEPGLFHESVKAVGAIPLDIRPFERLIITDGIVQHTQVAIGG